MKKMLVTVLSAAIVIGSVFSLTACGGKETAATETPAASDAKQETAIVGEWKNDSLGSYEYIYTFSEDGTGQYDAAGTIMPFTYEIDGDKISILYEGNTDPFETTFSIDGDTLNVLDSLGKDTLYKKIK